MNKREFLQILGNAVGFSALFAIGFPRQNIIPSHLTPEMKRRGILRPPGSVLETEFLSRCIRCQRCAQVCETNAIKYFGPGSGKHEGLPYIIPETHPCNLCLECGKACPSGAILPLTNRKDAGMGSAVVDVLRCVSHNGTGICGACFTMCPLHGKAIVQGKHNQPIISQKDCVGCGLCENVCIVKGDKAIRIFSSRNFI